MKKIVAVILCIMMMGAMSGCGGASSSDVDLTKMSATMVYSEVYNMVYTPEDYVGKTIKMRGLFTAMYDEAQEKIIHTCIIEDATQCCAQGIQFDLTEIPDVYPEGGTEVTVEGVFDTYEINGETGCYLKDSVFVE